MSAWDDGINNAVIESVTITTERVLSSWIQVTYGGSGQGFGGYFLGGPYMAVWIEEILKVLEVEKWENLKGKSCRIDIRDGLAYGIGNLLTDKWFYPKEVFNKMQMEEPSK